MMTNAPATASRRRYRARKAAGICTQCGAAPAVKNRRVCEPCRVATNQTNQKRQAKLRRLALVLNICRQCLQRQSIRGLKWCAVCAEAHTERQRVKREACRSQGLCTRCGGAKPCESCRAFLRERNRQWRAKQASARPRERTHQPNQAAA